MGRIVGLTLLFLGVWIIYSLVRYGREFRLQSRWMVVISLARNWLGRSAQPHHRRARVPPS